VPDVSPAAGANPFVGREDEIEMLGAGLDAAIAGRGGRLFLIGGEPGIGKSRLVDEFSNLARSSGARLLYGRCWEAGGAPTFWPWVQALRSYVVSEPPSTLRRQLGSAAADLAQMVPDIDEVLDQPPSPSPGGAEEARFRLFDATAQFLQRASESGALVVVLDDFDVADMPSFLLLQFVARGLADSRVIIVVTYRSGDHARVDGLGSSLDELAVDGATRSIRLRGLSETDVGLLVATVTPTPPSPGVIAALHRETEGNPLFVSEVVRMLVEEDGFGRVGIDPLGRLPIPETVRAVIGRRVERLSPECARVLRLASVIGREFDIGTLATIAGTTTEQLLTILDESSTVRVTSVVPVSVDRLRFSHALIRDAFYRSLPTPQRQQLHRELASVLERRHRSQLDDHIAEIAHHSYAALPAGDVEEAARYARRAGDRALSMYGYEDAIRFFHMSLDALRSSSTSSDVDRCDLLLALGEAQDRAGDLGSARATYLEAAELARRRMLPVQLARAAIGYGGRFVWGRSANDPTLRPLLQDALAMLDPADSPERVRLLGRLACACRGESDRNIAASMSASALEMAHRLGDSSAIAYARVSHNGATYWYDNVSERLERAFSESAEAAASADKERLLSLHLDRTSALLELGRISAAERCLDELARLADEIREPAYIWMATSIRVLLALMRGEFAIAEQLMLQERQVGDPALTAECMVAHRAHEGWLRKQLGRFDDLETFMVESAEVIWWYPLFRCFLAEWYADVDDAVAARAAFDLIAADDFAGLLPRDNEWLLGATVLADVCCYLDDDEHAEMLYAELLPFAHLNATGIPELSRGSVSRALGALAGTLGRFDDADRHFHEALGANRRLGARPWIARTLYDHALTLQCSGRPGDPGRADHLLADAYTLAESLGMELLVTKIAKIGGRVDPRSPRTQTTMAVQDPTARLRREGDVWSVQYGGDSFFVNHLTGFAYLARLLAAPGDELHALSLSSGQPERPSTTIDADSDLSIGGFGDTGPILDSHAKAEYRRRILELQQDIDEATGWNDPARAERARLELEFIEQELRAAIAIGGRDRRTSGAAERARVNVTRAIRSAVERLGAHSPALGAHLDASISTGAWCSYAPAPDSEIRWEL
jgi:predicted ATPase